MIRQAKPSADIAVLRDSIRVRDGEVSYTWYPDNAYREYQRTPADLPEILNRHFTTALQQWNTDQAFTTDHVLACVRAEIEAPPSSVPRQRFAKQEIAGDFYQYFCGDTEAGITILNEDHVAELRKADADFDQAIVSNVVKLSGPIKYNPTASMTLVTSGGNYESSLILVPEVWATLVKRHGDDLAFVLPARDLFLVAAITDSDGIARMRTSAREFYAKSAYAISPLVYRYYNGEISVLSP